MTSLNISPIMIEMMRLAQAEPVMAGRDPQTIDADARRFEDLLNAGQSTREAPEAARTWDTHVTDQPALQEADDGGDFQGETQSDRHADAGSIDAQEDPGAFVQWPFAQQTVEGVKAGEPVAKVFTAARVEVAGLVEQIADRIVVEGPTSSQPVVEIHLAEEVLPDTTIRVTRSGEGLEVALSTANADSHAVLTSAVADLGARLALLGGAEPVLIRVAMHGGETSEFSFNSGPGGGRRGADRQRKVTRGHA